MPATGDTERCLMSRRNTLHATSGIASGAAVLTTTYGSPDRESVLPSLSAWAQQAYGSSSVVFSAILARMALFSEARFQLQALDDKHTDLEVSTRYPRVRLRSGQQRVGALRDHGGEKILAAYPHSRSPGRSKRLRAIIDWRLSQVSIVSCIAVQCEQR